MLIANNSLFVTTCDDLFCKVGTLSVKQGAACSDVTTVPSLSRIRARARAHTYLHTPSNSRHNRTPIIKTIGCVFLPSILGRHRSSHMKKQHLSKSGKYTICSCGPENNRVYIAWFESQAIKYCKAGTDEEKLKTAQSACRDHFKQQQRAA